VKNAQDYINDESKEVRHLHVEHRLEAAFNAGLKEGLEEAIWVIVSQEGVSLWTVDDTVELLKKKTASIGGNKQ